ncbi:CopD family protein [uncultured Pseudoteredinibacter sp.]|uniref:CopD family protein n=1 Tax=uncultured Pseudoteredinibacter sp. TaxID=1641701 RepID=UPI002604D737|nr:CopD family protein [uncultured Pseudoteredinibacter sp.]
MEMHIWNGLIVLSKVLFYTGFASIVSYAFLFKVPLLKPKYTKLIVIANIANLLWFIANSGAMAEEGLRGAFDQDILLIMIHSPIGSSALLRAIGLFFALLIIIKGQRKVDSTPALWIRSCILILSIILLTYSFTLIGHVSELDYLAKLSLMIHALVMAWWFGSLPSLAIACKTLETRKLKGLMDRFGKQASILVTLLLFAGLYLGVSLNSGLNSLFYTDHGRVLLLKVVFVVIILGIAANHKLRLVPSLNHKQQRNKLANSIYLEMGIASSILLLTSVLTSVVSPDL